MLFGFANSVSSAAIMLMLVGTCGGFYVVPLNALLQERGHETVGSGHAIATQNFFENCCMVSMIGLYTLMAKSGIPTLATVTAFGAFVLLGTGLLGWWYLSTKMRTHQKRTI